MGDPSWPLKYDLLYYTLKKGGGFLSVEYSNTIFNAQEGGGGSWALNIVKKINFFFRLFFIKNGFWAILGPFLTILSHFWAENFFWAQIFLKIFKFFFSFFFVKNGF